MKILWYINCILPYFRDVRPAGNNYGCPWGDALIRYHEEKKKFDLAVVSPEPVDKVHQAEKNGIRYYGFPQDDKYKMMTSFCQILEKENPDIIHMWGTESPLSYYFFRACEKRGIDSKVGVHIQGLVSVCAYHIRASLPEHVIYGATLKDVLRRTSIRGTEKVFTKTGKMEKYILSRCKYVFGRTEWDRACCTLLNDSVQFHYSREMMRESFFYKKWSYEGCEKHTIFMRGGSWCIKGLHYVLRAMPLIQRRYPDVKLYVASAGLERKYTGTVNEKLKASYYDRYILSLMNRLGIRDKVVLLDQLDDEGMGEYYMRANVFISSSTIENLCNCLLEARLIGTPVIASFAGGMPSSVLHGKTGYLYQHDAFYMIAYYVIKIFGQEDKVMKLSVNERKWAHRFANRDTVYEELLETYQLIIDKDMEIVK